MTGKRIGTWVALSMLLLSACQGRRPPGSVPLDGVACVGKIQAPGSLREIRDDALLQSALAATGKGQLCIGRAYETTRPMTVYRMWSIDKPFSRYGRWWSMQQPPANTEEYRKQYAICPEWNSLTMMSTCTIRVGTHIVIGPGQSADCNGGLSFAKSAANQVFVPNNSARNEIFVEDCHDTPTQAVH